MLRALTGLLLSVLLAFVVSDALADRPRTGARLTPPRFDYAGFERPLRRISWAALGHDLARLQPLLGREAAMAASGSAHVGGCAPRASASGPQSAKSSDELRRTVRAQIARLAGSGISGTGPHGVFAHPAVLVNAIHFTLSDARQPLTDRQAEELFHLGRQYVAQERERVRDARSEPLALVRLLDESRLRTRMVEWAAATLTPRQQSVLMPESTRDLVGWNYFNGTSVLAPQAHPVAYGDKSQLVDALLHWQIGRFGFGEREQPIVRSHIARFVAALPAEPACHKRGILSVSYTSAVAAQTAKLHRVLLSESGFTWAQRDRLRREQRFCVPVRIAQR